MIHFVSPYLRPSLSNAFWISPQPVTQSSSNSKIFLFCDALELNVVFTLIIALKVGILGINKNISKTRNQIKLKLLEQNSLSIPK